MSLVEELVLERILKGLIYLNGDGKVVSFHTSHRRWIVKQPNYHPLSGRTRYSFRHGGTGKNIYANRLIWMIVNRQSIPDGHFVDHQNENRLDDRAENLKLTKVGESHKQGQRIQQDTVLEQLSRWFEWMGSYGREPELPHEISWVEVGF